MRHGTNKTKLIIDECFTIDADAINDKTKQHKNVYPDGGAPADDRNGKTGDDSNSSDTARGKTISSLL